jgi:RsmE family RNA methyltransferase
MDYNQDTIVLIGPEGGFSNEEISIFQHLNITFVKLDEYTLRAETAIISCIFAIKTLYQSNKSCSI